MQRFFGLMPRSEIEREETFNDSQGRTVTISAGPNGWTVLYGSNSTDYADAEATTDENFDTAYQKAVEVRGTLTSTVPELDKKNMIMTASSAPKSEVK